MLGPSNDKIPSQEWQLAKRMAHEGQRIQHSNDQFASAAAAEKRTIIAKDVLEWLRIGKLRAHHGNYLGVIENKPVAPPNVPSGLFSIFNRSISSDVVNGGSCFACALGAIIACAAERKFISSIKNEYGYLFNSTETIIKMLIPWFTRRQLIEIEGAFETDECATPGLRVVESGLRVGTKPGASEAAIRFNNGVKNPRDRMERIMRNIVLNHGTFKP